MLLKELLQSANYFLVLIYSGEIKLLQIAVSLKLDMLGATLWTVLSLPYVFVCKSFLYSNVIYQFFALRISRWPQGFSLFFIFFKL